MAERQYQQHDMDKGYAWIILIGCTTMYFLLGGSTKSYGILYVEFLHHFRSGSGSTAWMPSIFYFIAFGLGPFSNYFGQKVSFRVACFIGALVLSAGYVFSAFVTRMEHMYITYGIICGLGYGISFSPFSTLVTYYFDKRRSLVNGIVTASSGAGSFVFPLLYRYLIDYYGLKGALWIIGAILLHACPAACLLRQPHMFTRKENEKLIRSTEESVAKDICDKEQNESCAMLQTEISSIPKNRANDTERIRHCNTRETELGTKMQELHNDNDKSTDQLFINQKVPNILTDVTDSNVTNQIDCVVTLTATSTLKSTTDDVNSSCCSEAHESEIDDSQLPASESGHEGETVMVVLDWQSKIIDQSANGGRSDESLHKNELFCSICPNLRFSLFRNPKFVVLAMSLWLFMVGFVVNLVVFPAHIVQVGLSDKDASICISILGVADVIARVGLGWFADRKIVDLKWIFVVNMLIGGVFGIILPYFKSFAFMAIYSVIVGVFIGSFWGLFPAALVATIGLKDFAAGYGLMMMGFGVLAAGVLPFIGWLDDVTGSWDTSFRVTGTILLLAAVTRAFDGWIVRFFMLCRRRA